MLIRRSEPAQFATEAWLYAIMEEYKTLREESLRSIATQHQVIAYAIGALGVLVLAGMNAWDGSVAAAPITIFIIIIPAVSAFSLVLCF